MQYVFGGTSADLGEYGEWDEALYCKEGNRASLDRNYMWMMLNVSRSVAMEMI